jgi:FlaA1/EpsC-like NDP-sugar epimerase
MFKLPKYKNNVLATNLLVIANSITFALSLVLLVSKKYQRPSGIILASLSILSILFFIYVFVCRSNKTNKEDYFQSLFVLLYRIGGRRFYSSRILGGRPEKNLLIISNGNSGNKLKEKLLAENNSRINIKGYIDYEDDACHISFKWEK